MGSAALLVMLMKLHLFTYKTTLIPAPFRFSNGFVIALLNERLLVKQILHQVGKSVTHVPICLPPLRRPDPTRLSAVTAQDEINTGIQVHSAVFTREGSQRAIP